MATVNLDAEELTALISLAVAAGNSELAKKLYAQAPPALVPCPHAWGFNLYMEPIPDCGDSFSAEADLVAHLIAKHHYVDDPYGDDTSAQYTADSQFRSYGRK